MGLVRQFQLSVLKRLSVESLFIYGLFMIRLRGDFAEEGLGEMESVRSAAVAIRIAFELTVLLFALLSVNEFRHQIDVQSLPVCHEVLCL